MGNPDSSQIVTKKIIPAQTAPRTGVIRIGVDQNIGASPKRHTMEDSSFAENLVTAGGFPVTLAVVADGIGGASSGERASNLAVERIVDSVRESDGEDFPRILETAFQQANRAVYEEAREDDNKRDMGSTVTAAIVYRHRLYLASVGDSRAYLIRGNAVIQLTSDHNWGEEMIRLGKLRPQEVSRNPHAAALMRSIGAESEVQVDLGVYWNSREAESAARSRQGTPLQPGDHVLLCSDGLIKERPDGRGHYVEPHEMPEILSRNPPLQAARTLVSKAMGRNANDNVTAIVLQRPGAAAGRRVFRCGIIVILLSALLWAASMLPSLLSRIPAGTPKPDGGSIQIQRITGEVLYMESGQTPANLDTVGSFPVKPGGTLRSLEGTLQFALPDSVRVYLDRFSEITLTQIGDSAGGGQTNSLTLEQGRALIVLPPRPGYSGFILAPQNLRAQVLGSVMGAAYDPADSRLEVDCLEGSCLLANAAKTVHLSGGQFSYAGADSIGPVAGARYDLWAGLGASDPAWITATPMPTGTATATPTETKIFAPVKTTEAPPPPGTQPTATTEPSPTVEPTVEPPTAEPPTAESTPGATSPG